MKFKTVGVFSNETEKDMTLFLELKCEEVILSPGDKVELLVEDNEEHFPISVLYHLDSLQIYPEDGFPEWRIKYKGKEITPDYPTRLKDYG